jgi:two-component system nitrate/nitrite response regulator NarL
MSRIFLLVNDPAVAVRMRRLIVATAGLEVTGSAHTFAQARRHLPDAMAELLLADLQLADGGLTAFLAEMHNSLRYGQPKTLAVTLSLDDPQLLDALCHGADGYFVQGRPAAELIAAIEQTLNGGAEMAPAIARQVKSHFDAIAALAPTASERLLLQSISDGFLAHEIARDLSISPREVAQRVRLLYRRLQAECRAGSALRHPLGTTLGLA